jgi:diketogulonate reductase-like aldo/keto reductase
MNFKTLTDCYTLSNGVKVPCIGFGTWQVKDGETASASVHEALRSGYRHIDTAAAYHNEESVGIGIKESGVARKDIFITGKLHCRQHGYEKAHAAFEQTLKDLGLDYLDLYMIHWPNPINFRDCWQEANAGSWKAFEELHKAGKIRALGVSNFRIHHLEALLKTAKVPPVVNQIRICPGEHLVEVIDFCGKHDMLMEAYSPLGTGKTFEVSELKQLSQKYNKSIAQICVRWSLQHGYLPLPKSVTPERIRQNAEVFDFEISAPDMALIDSLEGCCDYSRNPDTIEF